MSWGHWSGDREEFARRTRGVPYVPGRGLQPRRSGLERLICSGCLRLRFSPVHLLWRAVGLCDGRSMWPG